LCCVHRQAPLPSLGRTEQWNILVVDRLRGTVVPTALREHCGQPVVIRVVVQG
jgi:hypothetical protein